MENSHFDFKEELKKLPDKPGVYIMHDVKDTIIYVGKAVNLNNRVRSYFRENIGRGPKIDKMVSLIDYFEYIVTDSELEALVLENNLIKEHHPKYNTMLMDDKTYPYIKITTGEKYPRILITRKMLRDKAKYFGPYSSSDKVREVVDMVNKMFGLRTCNNRLPGEDEESEDNASDTTKRQNKKRACLNNHIGLCCGPCVGNVTGEEYAERVKGALNFLNGDYSPVVKDLKEKMVQASDKMEFEEAAKYRDLIDSVMFIMQKQKIEDSALDDKDILGLALDGSDAVCQVFFVRGGRMVGREHYFMKNVGKVDDTNRDSIKAEVLSSFIKQFYAGTPSLPREIMIPYEIEDKNIIEEWLSNKKGNRLYITCPKKGQKEKLLELASKNAELVISRDKEKIKREEAMTKGAVHEIEDLLGLANIDRMEAFDISNISGFENVASMVVFEGGKPKKSDYRKFKIKTVAGPDDYACMREALMRRFTHEERHKADNPEKENSNYGFSKLPDLLLMDGGRGQVNIALDVLKELNIKVPVCGMVKDDNHHTRGIYFNNVEMPIDTRSEGFKLITRVQDEAHRFAIEYHRSLRTKSQVHSVLDDIPGIGEKRRIALMKAFSSIDELKNSSVEELAERGNLPKNIAEGIYDYFHKK